VESAAPESPNVAPLIEELERQLLAQYAPPRMKRDAHPKMHGCVQAILTVDKDLPADLRQGLFERPGEYFAWVRFSNAFRIQHDLEFETRGMAIKVLGVTGERAAAALENDDEHDTQDFLFATHDVFFLPNATYDYRGFAEATDQGQRAVLRFFLKARILHAWWALMRSAFVLARSPLDIQYFSQTPYRFGDEGHDDRPRVAVKLRARPRLTPQQRRSLPFAFVFWLKAAAATVALSVAQSRGPAAKRKAETFVDRYVGSRDLLRHALMATLSADDAVFDIAVQRRDASSAPVDDATVRWRESQWPFHRVAELRIPRQVFWPETGQPDAVQKATARMMMLGENMSFNPWHALAAHKPLGSINEARRRIYTKIAHFRREQNHVNQPVPTVEEYLTLQQVVQFGLITHEPE
jgi:hypothetical protein